MLMFMTVFVAILGQDAVGNLPPSPSEPAAEHAQDVRCAGVLYSAQQALRRGDQRQPAIQASLDAILQRIDARVSTGKVDEATVPVEMQAAVNEARADFQGRLDGCLTTTTTS